jgi:hypothetical protein
MDDQRPISGAEKTFFSLGTGRGISVFFARKFLTFLISQVPVVLIFTKFDALEDKCYSKLREQGKSHQEAKNELPELANKIFQNEYLSRIENTEFPPKTYVCLAGDRPHFSFKLYILTDTRNEQARQSMFSII